MPPTLTDHVLYICAIWAFEYRKSITYEELRGGSRYPRWADGAIRCGGSPAIA